MAARRSSSPPRRSRKPKTTLPAGLARPEDVMALHTDRQYEEELQQLRAKILEMGGLVEKQIGDAMASLVERNSAQAREVIERDHVVNHLDVAVDEACTRLLAVRQPAARDLRVSPTG